MSQINDYAYIQLTQGKVAKVDICDFESLSKFKWYAQRIGKNFYAARMLPKNGGKKTSIHMHRQIMGETNGLVVDHIDNDGLNNTRNNLRLCTKAENLRNRPPQVNNTSGVSGVHHNKNGFWEAYIRYNNKRVYLGAFRDKASAVRARIIGSRKYFKEYSYV